MITNFKKLDHDNFLSHLHTVMFHHWIEANITDGMLSEKTFVY